MLKRSRITIVLGAVAILLPSAVLGGKACPKKTQDRIQFTGVQASAEEIGTSVAKGTHIAGQTRTVVLSADGESRGPTTVIDTERAN